MRVHYVAIEGNGQLETVCLRSYRLRALNDGLVVAFPRSSVSNVCDADAPWQTGKPFLDDAGLEFGYQVKTFINVEFSLVEG